MGKCSLLISLWKGELCNLGNQPLNALMEEKLKISSVGPGEAVLTDCIDKFKNGTIVVIIGHPESWLTDTAKDIIETLRKEERIVFSFLDEFQMNLSSFWGKDFRYVKIKNDVQNFNCLSSTQHKKSVIKSYTSVLI